MHGNVANKYFFKIVLLVNKGFIYSLFDQTKWGRKSRDTVPLKDNMGSSVAGLTQGDYRMDGKLELIACATDGEGSLIVEKLTFSYIFVDYILFNRYMISHRIQ